MRIWSTFLLVGANSQNTIIHGALKKCFSYYGHKEDLGLPKVVVGVGCFHTYFQLSMSELQSILSILFNFDN